MCGEAYCASPRILLSPKKDWDITLHVIEVVEAKDSKISAAASEAQFLRLRRGLRRQAPER